MDKREELIAEELNNWRGNIRGSQDLSGENMDEFISDLAQAIEHAINALDTEGRKKTTSSNECMFLKEDTHKCFFAAVQGVLGGLCIFPNCVYYSKNAMDKLLPCPFCGSDLIDVTSNTRMEKTQIMCTDCSIMISFDCNEEEAIKLWNTRHTPQDEFYEWIDEQLKGKKVLTPKECQKMLSHIKGNIMDIVEGDEVIDTPEGTCPISEKALSEIIFWAIGKMDISINVPSNMSIKDYSFGVAKYAFKFIKKNYFGTRKPSVERIAEIIRPYILEDSLNADKLAQAIWSEL